MMALYRMQIAKYLSFYLLPSSYFIDLTIPDIGPKTVLGQGQIKCIFCWDSLKQSEGRKEGRMDYTYSLR